MEGGNHVLRNGHISKWPLAFLLLVLMLTAVAAYVSMGNEPTADPIKEEKLTDNTALMLSQGDKLIKQLEAEKEHAALEQELSPATDAVQNTENDPEELRAKAQVLSEEARQAREYADELEGKNFKQDYDAYLEKSSVQPKSAYPAFKETHKDDFSKILRAPTRIDIFDKPSEKQNTIPSGYLPTAQTPDSFSYEGSKQRKSARTLEDYAVFNRGDDFELDKQVKKLKSPLCLRQGSIIPAMLLTAINSDLPGLVSAQTTVDVLDSVYGREILIPKGTKVMGEYEAAPGYGQERVFIGFKRLLFPDGSSLNLGAMPGQSQDGRSGFDADVDNHLFGIVSSALLLSAVSAGVSSTQSRGYDAQGRIHYGDALGSAAAASLGNTLGQIIEKNLNLSQTLNVKPGYVFNVSVVKDIYFNAPWGDPDFSSN